MEQYEIQVDAVFALWLLATLAMPVSMAAQTTHRRTETEHHHYKLIKCSHLAAPAAH